MYPHCAAILHRWEGTKMLTAYRRLKDELTGSMLSMLFWCTNSFYGWEKCWWWWWGVGGGFIDGTRINYWMQLSLHFTLDLLLMLTVQWLSACSVTWWFKAQWSMVLFIADYYYWLILNLDIQLFVDNIMKNGAVGTETYGSERWVLFNCRSSFCTQWFHKHTFFFLICTMSFL